MNKTDIIKAIAEHEDHTIQRGLFGDVIVNACIEQVKQPLDIERIKPLIDSINYLIKVIELSDRCAKLCSLGCVDMYGMTQDDHTRQANKYRESLTKTLEQL